MSVPSKFSQELRSLGFTADSPWDLVNSRRTYRTAIPLLVEWLDRAEREIPAPDRETFREGVVRALAVKEARGMAAPALLREFRRPGSSSEYRWAVANTLEVVADDSVFDDVASIASDRRFGRDRQMVVLALARMTRPQAIEVLRRLLSDDTVVGHALMALGRLKAREARKDIERCSSHPKAWVRREARRALAKLEG